MRRNLNRQWALKDHMIMFVYNLRGYPVSDVQKKKKNQVRPFSSCLDARQVKAAGLDGMVTGHS